MRIYRAESAAEFAEYAHSFLALGWAGCVYHISPDRSVWTGQLPTLDPDACARHGLTVGQGQYLGGSIVNMPGDLSICITTWGNSELAPRIVERMTERLRELGEVSMDENDILLEGKKVVSWARATTVKGWCQSVIHCSVGPMDLDLVREICTKPMEKVPGSLGDYGVTAEELWSIAEPMIKGAT